jgi:hypothetical protein
MKTLIGIIISLCSCNFTDANHWDVCQEAKVHVESFYREAGKRGIRLQHLNMNIFKSDLIHGSPSAWGMTYSNTPPIISLDEDFVHRLTQSPIRKSDSLLLQYVVFHELGHAVLLRDHNHDYSMMSSPVGYQSDYVDNAELRQKLIDELFQKSIIN